MLTDASGATLIRTAIFSLFHNSVGPGHVGSTSSKGSTGQTGSQGPGSTGPGPAHFTLGSGSRPGHGPPLQAEVPAGHAVPVVPQPGAVPTVPVPQAPGVHAPVPAVPAFTGAVPGAPLRQRVQNVRSSRRK